MNLNVGSLISLNSLFYFVGMLCLYFSFFQTKKCKRVHPRLTIDFMYIDNRDDKTLHELFVKISSDPRLPNPKHALTMAEAAVWQPV